jgi:hypothetical protein
VDFGESGKNFIEIGKRHKVRETMLRRAALEVDEFRVVEKPCRNANLEEAIWKFRPSDWAAWE